MYICTYIYIYIFIYLLIYLFIYIRHSASCEALFSFLSLLCFLPLDSGFYWLLRASRGLRPISRAHIFGAIFLSFF